MSEPNILIPESRLVYAYIAGFVDGEGCIRINKTKTSVEKPRRNPAYSLICSVANTDLPVLEYIQNYFGGSICLCAGNNRVKPCWDWRIYGNKALDFLCRIVDFLRVKRKEAEIAISFQRYKSQLPRGRGKIHSSGQTIIFDEVYKILASAKREIIEGVNL